MSDNRREFLKKSMLMAGAALTGSSAAQGGVPPSSAGSCCSSPAALTPALTADGRLIRLLAEQVVSRGKPAADPQVRAGVPGRKWVMVIDLAKCDGCKKCTEACGKMHFTPPDREWIRVFQMKEARETTPYWFPKPCFHCDNPPCTKVCPVGATFKRTDGVVLIDNERCIGCRFCMAACPYSTRYFNWGRPQNTMADQDYSPEKGFPRRIGTVEKCDFCPDMAASGQLPACVTNCAMGTLYYGDQNEDAVTNSKGETEQLSKLLRERAGYRYLEELGTEPRVYYLPPKGRMYPAPGEPTQPTPKA